MKRIIMKILVIISIVLVISGASNAINKWSSPWTWRCVERRCMRTDSQGVEDGMSLVRCKLVCDENAMLWPLPSAQTVLGNHTVGFQLANVHTQVAIPEQARPMMYRAVDIFSEYLRNMHSTCGKNVNTPGQGNRQNFAGTASETKVNIFIQVDNGDTRLLMDTSEFYQLKVQANANNSVTVSITAHNFFGARHGLETLSQLIVYDCDISSWEMLSMVSISDAPVYPIRALTLDTSRNFISVDGIKRTIDGMSYNKLNTLHWHITDTHSFPIEIPQLPNMTRYGAYSPSQVYSQLQVQQLVHYAMQRGVRLLPEFDAPAHVGFGWQWGEEAGLGKMVVCLNREPWQKYCVEPPCGQMNIINENMYHVLEKIMMYYNSTFQPEFLHLGGDEINLNCWKSTPEISKHVQEKGENSYDDEPYMQLWIGYQKRALGIWHRIVGQKRPVILWTSHLTERTPDQSQLDPNDYIIQVWTTGDDEKIGELLRQGYRLIMSNYDAWYLDCGFSAWVGTGNNWCTPYKSWQTVYDNSPRRIAERFASTSDDMRTSRRDATGSVPDYSRQMLGGSAALWTEQADDQTLDVKLWPRGAALAERLWTEPMTDSLAAEYRYVNHRQRMVQRGIMAETVQPQFCHQYEGRCYI